MNCSSRCTTCTTLVVTLACGIWSSRLNAVNTPILGGIRTVALSNDSFQGVPSGIVIDQFATPRTDSSGRVGFKARLRQGPGSVDFTNDTAIWSESEPGVLRYVAREGDPVPGFNLRFNEPEPGENLRMSNAGDVYFIAGIASTSGPSISSSGIFKFSPSTGFQVMAVSSPVGASIPTAGGAGTFFSNFMDFNEAGNITMQTGTGSGPIWALDASGLASVPTGLAAFPAINEAGDIAYRATNSNSVHRIDVWNRTKPVRTVASENQIAPGTGGSVFMSMGDQSSFANANGKVSFIARLSGAGISESNDFGVWSETTPGGPIALDLREGQHAPGTMAGDVWSIFNQFFVPLIFNRSSGSVALRLDLSGPDVTTANDKGVWAGTSPSQLHLVAREGDQAPGTEPGTLFSDFGSATTTTDGRGVFVASLSANGLDPNRSSGIWAEGLDGILHLVARRGDYVQLPSGEVTQLTSLEYNPDMGVGGLGYVSFISNLANGQRGVFVSNIALVPEPSTLAQAYLGILAIAALVGIRCRNATA
jgi:hypothetical protein